MDLYTLRNELNNGKSIFDLPLRVTFYARVSTGTDEQTHSLQNQISYYADFIGNNPKWTYVEGYIDEALSGTSVNKREAFLRMIDDAKLKKFDFIITKEISRFSRNTLDSIRYTQELLAASVGVLFQSDNINTLMPDAELRLTIMSSIAQDEVRKISERVRFGFKRAIEKGVVLGNSKIWGYTKQDGKLVIVPEEAELVRRIFTMYATQGMGIRAICSRLSELGYTNGNGNDFSFSTVKSILVNPKYMGYYCGNKTHKIDYRRNGVKTMDASEWVLYKDEENVPPIVTEELWNRANAILKERSKKMSSEDKTGYQNRYAYSGKICCGGHNAPYYRSVYRYPSGDKEVWQCREYVSKGKNGCNSPAVYSSELDHVLRGVISFILMGYPDLISGLLMIYRTLSSQPSSKDELAKHRVKALSLQARRDKLLDLSISGCLSDQEFLIRNRRFTDEIESLWEQIQKHEEQERKNREVLFDPQPLRQVIAEELTFHDGFTGSVTDALIEQVTVLPTGMKNAIDLQVTCKVFKERLTCTVSRGRKTSVCSASYILRVSKDSCDYARGDGRQGRVGHTHTYQVNAYLQVGG
jgi:DNA invertase Pin-like site-specific DNA recombinase